MKSQSSLGLVVEGNATSSSVLRLPNIAAELGPIKASVLRVGRRLSNFLRAGNAVNTYEELQPARLILLRVPDTSIARTVSEICDSELVLKDLSFVLCDSCFAASVLRPLQLQGASTATLLAIPSGRPNWFVIEGQLGAVRQTRRFLERNDARAFELRPGTKSLYFAAHLLATYLPAQLYAHAEQALRAAGMSGNHLYDLLHEMSVEMFRSFSSGARMRLPGARLGCPPELGEEYLNHLRTNQPQIAEVIDAQLLTAVHHEPKGKGRAKDA